jgi:hypothetical protein
MLVAQRRAAIVLVTGHKEVVSKPFGAETPETPETAETPETLATTGASVSLKRLKQPGH